MFPAKKKRPLAILLGTDKQIVLAHTFLQGLREKHDMSNTPHVVWCHLYSPSDFRVIPYIEHPEDKEKSIRAFLQVQTSKNIYQRLLLT